MDAHLKEIEKREDVSKKNKRREGEGNPDKARSYQEIQCMGNIYVCKMSMGLGYDPKGHGVKHHSHF